MKDLFKKLEIIGQLDVSSWRIVMAIQKEIAAKKAVAKGEYFNEFDKKYKTLDLSKLETWSTYEDCVDLRFTKNLKKEQLKNC